MYLYIFKLTFQDNSQKNYYKFCIYPKKTKIYKDCINLLNKDIIKRFTYYSNNNLNIIEKKELHSILSDLYIHKKLNKEFIPILDKLTDDINIHNFI